MGRSIQIVTGPAGVGKNIAHPPRGLWYLIHCLLNNHQSLTFSKQFVGNIDPAAEHFEYEVSFDIKSIITVDEVMEQMNYGPNGGLVYCMEFLLQNSDWLKDELDKFGDDDYVVLDCPGQIELYSHLPIMHNLVRLLEMWGYRVVSVYLIDALFVLEPAKFISGCLLSLSCMLQLELPHINIITKVDLADKEEIKHILDSEGSWMVQNLDKHSSGKLKKLTQAISNVIDDYMMVSFLLLDITDEDSIEEIMSYTDQCIQYDEDVEPKDPRENEMEDEELKESFENM